MTPDAPAPRAGLVAVVGRASVGKSTLLNAIVGEKVSIVSPVPQTTRTLIRAMLTEPRGQLAFLDTPGVHRATYDLGKLMNRVARHAIEGVDAVLLVLDCSEKPREEDEGWMRRLLHEATPCLLVLNKADLGRRAELYHELWQRLVTEKQVTGRTPEWFSVSARTGEGVAELIDRLFALVPEGPALFPGDVLSDYPRKLAIADVVREKYYAVLRDELPHALAVEIEKIDETAADGGWQLTGTLYVQKNSQKGIVLGPKGRLLKKIVGEAERELAALYERPVRLELWVKVQPDWARNFWMLQRLGYT